ncbi:MAG: methyltransferase domain-containing protein [Thermotogota bacterium]|nr:methyltransferase domain-containing protein [Thermotogota bacterium]
MKNLKESNILDLLNDVGFTKHVGGLKATKELINLCDIGKGKYVLDVGCGVGITPCYIAKKYDCKVVGIDILEKMVDSSKKRAEREGIDERVEFRLADAQNLPFEDDFFDVVISEDAIAIMEDKKGVISECVRVTKKGGYVGLCSMSWIKASPPELVEDLSFFGDIPTFDGWQELLKDSGLRDVIGKIYKVTALSEIIDQSRWLGFKDFLKGWYKFLSANRRFIKESSPVARDITNYLGCGIYVGRK